MAQHSKPFYWLKTLAANSQITRNREASPHELEPVPKRSTHWRPLTRLLPLMSSLALSCVVLPAYANTETVYIVEVLSNSEEVLEVVRSAVSDAYIVTKEDGTQSIIAGTFVDEANARRQASELHALNVSPTSVSPFEYTLEDESNLADASADGEHRDEVAADSTSPSEQSAATDSVASSEPTANATAPNTQPVVQPSEQPQSVAAAPPVNQQANPGGGSTNISTSSDRQYSTLVTIPDGSDPETALTEVQHFFPEASLQSFDQGQAVQTGTFSHRSQAQLQAEWLQAKGLHAIAVPTKPIEANSALEPSNPAAAAATAPSPATPVQVSTSPAGNASPVVESTSQTAVTSNAAAPSPGSTGTTASNTSPIVATPPPNSLASVAPPPKSPQGTDPSAISTTDSATGTALQAEQPAETAPVAAAPPVNSAAYWVLIADPIGEQLNDIRAIVPKAEATLYNQRQVVRTGEFATEEEALDQVRYLSTQGYEAGIFTADVTASN